MSEFGTYLKPFAADSLWNSVPLNPAFGSYQIPKVSTGWFPSIKEGAYSLQCFLAKPTDGPMQVFGTDGKVIQTQGPYSPDDGSHPVITIPHWPAATVAATGNDGHADIVDEEAGVIHSFWGLKNINGAWCVKQYSWAPLGGTGWGDGGHFNQGARAAGCATSAGLIRTHEVKDGDELYRHALAMSLDPSALAMPYAFPATSQDINAPSVYKGQIPMGSRMMLPPTFDYSAVKNPDLLKVIKTLMLFGAYVVDMNQGTPFAIYVENGSGFNLMPNGWDNTIATQLMSIANALRVATASQFVPGAIPFTPNQKVNLLSLRGGWSGPSGSPLGVFNSLQQRLIFPVTTKKIVQKQLNHTEWHPMPWAALMPGKSYALSVQASGGATLQIAFYDQNWGTILQTPALGDGQSATFTAPADIDRASLVASSGIGSTQSSVGATLIEQ